MERLLKDAERMGVTLDLGGNREEAEIWEWHLAAWNAWCAISGQWNSLALNTMERAKVLWIGIDYAAAAAGLTLAGIEMRPDLWAEVREIEAGAIEELNK